jgi:HAE1 family hydrophobic/amphiphilic exporter-1
MVRFSISRPITIGMAYLAISLLGVLAWRNLPIELLPETDLPSLAVNASWRGASPETVEAFLTSPLEAAIQQVRGVEKITSTSMENDGTGSATINVEFERETDMNFARLELSERLAALEEDLPAGISGPFVQQYVPEEFSRQRKTFLSYTLTGHYTLEALRQQVDDVIGPELRQVDGVSDIVARGGRRRLLELELNEGKIKSLGLNIGEIDRRIRDLEIVAEAGAVERGSLLYPIALRHRADSVAEVLNTPLITRTGAVVRLRELATVHDTYEEPTSYYRIDGRPAVSFDVLKSHRTNAVEVADRVKARMAALEPALLSGTRVILDQDQTETIKLQLHDLRTRSVLSAAIVFVVLLLFLRSFRSAAITFATIVFSVLITLNLMYFGGYTLNVLTLMGLAMGFGFMVDNAIVVLENIYRRRRLGESAEAAAERGTGEVFAAVLGATITNVIVLVPFVYLQGELKIFYVPLALVVGFSQLASLFVGFTFIPALAARALRSPKFAWKLAGASTREPIYKRGYAWLIARTLQWPWATVAFCVILLGGSYYLFQKYVTRGVLFRFGSDAQTYININIRQPRGEELDNTDGLARYFEERLKGVEFVKRFVTNVYTQSATINVTFPDSIQYTDAPVALKEQLSEYAVMFGSAQVSVYGYGPAFSGGGGFGGSSPNYSIKILGYNYEKVRDIAEDLAVKLRRFSRVREVDTNSGGNRYIRDKASEVVLTIDRSRLALHGMTTDDFVREVNAATRGRNRGNAVVRIAGDEVLYEVKLEGHRFMDVYQLNELLLPAPNGEQVRLGDVASLKEQPVIGRVIREDQQYQRLVAYEFRGPTKLGDRVKDAVIKSTELPPGFSLAEENSYRWSTEEKKQVWAVIAFGLVLIFMVTAGLFESIRQPIAVLLTVPMALIGVFLTFYFTRASFTREAYIGVIMMAGVVVNNAILLIDHVNQLRRLHGVPLHEALVRGSSERVRPILMTSVTTILGILPLVLFSKTADANIWNALGFAMIGGLASSTILVVTITPALYLLFERRRERKLAPPVEPALQPVSSN